MENVAHFFPYPFGCWHLDAKIIYELLWLVIHKYRGTTMQFKSCGLEGWVIADARTFPCLNLTASKLDPTKRLWNSSNWTGQDSFPLWVKLVGKVNLHILHCLSSKLDDAIYLFGFGWYMISYMISTPHLLSPTLDKCLGVGFSRYYLVQ